MITVLFSFFIEVFFVVKRLFFPGGKDKHGGRDPKETSEWSWQIKASPKRSERGNVYLKFCKLFHFKVL